MTKKIKRILPYTPKWEREANAIARDFAPPIYPCVHCGHPVARGYCCIFCGSSIPEGEPKDRQEFHDWVHARRTKSNEQD